MTIVSPKFAAQTTNAPLPDRSGPSAGFVLSPFSFLMSARRHPLLLIGVPLGLAVAAGAASFLLPTTYTATATFVPEVSASNNSLRGLASLAGIGLSVGSSTDSPEFYAELLRSRPIVNKVAAGRYGTNPDNWPALTRDSLPLSTLLGVTDTDSAQREAHTARDLVGKTAVNIDRRTGIVTIGVTTTRRALSAALVAAYLAELGQFNQLTRQSQASAKRRFAEAQTAQAQLRLRSTEDSLRAFYTANRNCCSSAPVLRFEEMRLERAVQFNTELYSSLQRELDAARVQEADDLPVFTVINSPMVPSQKAGPNRTRIVAVVFILALLAAAVALALYDHRAQLFDSSPDWAV